MQAQKSWDMGVVALQHTESSRTRDQTHVPCIGRWILHHRATGKVQQSISIVFKPPRLWNFQTKTEDREGSQYRVCKQGGDHYRQPEFQLTGAVWMWGMEGSTEQVPPGQEREHRYSPSSPHLSLGESCFFERELLLRALTPPPSGLP